jgi:exosortase/archaeosortase family protein
VSKTDFTVIIGLSFLALFIWLREMIWMSSADDTLPILAAIPLFIWIGGPWDFRDHSLPLSTKGLVIFAVFFLLGTALNISFFLAISWTALLVTWLLAAVISNPERSLSKLLVLPLMAFPWVSLDLNRLGWWFRLSGAWATAQVLPLFNFHVSQQGTSLMINETLVNVDVACAGLNTLQSMLIAGSIVAYLFLKDSNRYWLSLPFLFFMAWLSNVIRIIAVSLATMFVSPQFATGAFHQIGGWFILIVMFSVCWLFFSFLTPKNESQ